MKASEYSDYTIWEMIRVLLGLPFMLITIAILPSKFTAKLIYDFFIR